MTRTPAEQFVEEVSRRDHPLHSAWVELNKRGFRRGLFVPKDEVQTMLEGIRQDFPQLEQRFDPQRVGAWDAKLYPADMDSGGFQDALTKGGGLGLVLVFGLLRMAPIFYRLIHPHPADHPAPTDAAAPTPDDNVLALNRAAQHWFGASTDFAALGRMAPLVGRLAAADAGGTTDTGAADMAMRDAVFQSLAVAVPSLDPARLRTVQAVRARALAAAAAGDAGACMDFLKRGQLDDKVVLPQSTADAAVAQVRAIAAAGLYGNDPPRVSMQAAIPGSVVYAIIASTSLPPKAVQAAFQHHGPDEAQCAVHRALIREALKLPGRTGEAILRIE